MRLSPVPSGFLFYPRWVRKCRNIERLLPRQENRIMAAKNRTIYFYVPQIKDQNDRLKNLPPDFWTMLWDKVNSLEESTFQFSSYGRDYLIQARHCIAPSAKYLYFGKARNREDWPDLQDKASIVGLAASGVSGNLVESAYLTDAGIELVVAVARTSGGPGMSAIEKGINSLMNNLQKGEEFCLAAYVRQDQFARLNKSSGVSKLHLKLPADTQPEQLNQEGNDLSAALASAKRLDGEDAMTIDVTLSFGNKKPSQEVIARMGDAFKRLAGDKEKVDLFDKASATIITETEQGAFKKDQIDLISDRVTLKESFSTGADEQPKPEQVVQALLEASTRLQQMIRETT